MKSVEKLPKNLYKFFWDIDQSTLDPSEKPQYVIQRLLDKGDENAVRWVRQNFSKDEITETFYTMRDFKPKIGMFWTLINNLSKDKVLCLQEPYLTTRKNLWPY